MTFKKVWDGSWDPWRGPGRVGVPSGKSETGLWTLEEVRDVFGGPSGRSGTVRGTLGEVREGSADSRGGPERVVGPSEKSRMGWRTLGEDRDG